MQNYNRIQIVTKNTNAINLGVMVVGGTNAHRAYLSLKPCAPSPVKKGSDPGAWSSMSKRFQHSQRCSPFAQRGTALAGSYEASGLWRLQSRYSLMPVGIEATPVFRRSERD